MAKKHKKEEIRREWKKKQFNDNFVREIKEARSQKPQGQIRKGHLKKKHKKNRGFDVFDTRTVPQNELCKKEHEWPRYIRNMQNAWNSISKKGLQKEKKQILPILQELYT